MSLNSSQHTRHFFLFDARSVIAALYDAGTRRRTPCTLRTTSKTWSRDDPESLSITSMSSDVRFLDAFVCSACFKGNGAGRKSFSATGLVFADSLPLRPLTTIFVDALVTLRLLCEAGSVSLLSLSSDETKLYTAGRLLLGRRCAVIVLATAWDVLGAA